MPFIDRVTELQFLETKWLSGKAELLVLWGKRKITSLRGLNGPLLAQLHPSCFSQSVAQNPG
jgi:hypothetical protein